MRYQYPGNLTFKFCFAFRRTDMFTACTVITNIYRSMQSLLYFGLRFRTVIQSTRSCKLLKNDSTHTFLDCIKPPLSKILYSLQYKFNYKSSLAENGRNSRGQMVGEGYYMFVEVLCPLQQLIGNPRHSDLALTVCFSSIYTC
jgi:hypothetical protein